MPNEMNHADLADRLEKIADATFPQYTQTLRQAAADERRIANGELVPVVRGKWGNDLETGDFICTNCGYTAGLIGNGVYCPSCGALMDGKDDNHE